MVELINEAGRKLRKIYGAIAEQRFVDLSTYSDHELVLIRDFMNAGRDFVTERAAGVGGWRKRDRRAATWRQPK